MSCRGVYPSPPDKSLLSEPTGGPTHRTPGHLTVPGCLRSTLSAVQFRQGPRLARLQLHPSSPEGYRHQKEKGERGPPTAFSEHKSVGEALTVRRATPGTGEDSTIWTSLCRYGFPWGLDRSTAPRSLLQPIFAPGSPWAPHFSVRKQKRLHVFSGGDYIAVMTAAPTWIFCGSEQPSSAASDSSRGPKNRRRHDRSSPRTLLRGPKGAGDGQGLPHPDVAEQVWLPPGLWLLHGPTQLPGADPSLQMAPVLPTSLSGRRSAPARFQATSMLILRWRPPSWIFASPSRPVLLLLARAASLKTASGTIARSHAPLAQLLAGLWGF
ncbi:hypothetical protein NDU88_007537 [Pleurodeles waltl]|uniref:Uncharacterized protein n=1 Tax=Pleurodeles waltl TaxID=8319 RepID=A0AAV7NV86_PLEWA|nr:hypothetical protein NDU88_007537 [Pleurodeles waltl]